MQAQTWVTLAVGLLAAAGVIGTLWQRQRSESEDRRLRLEYEARAEWWRRFEWAAQLAISSSASGQEFGLAIVDALATSPLVTPSEHGILAVMGALGDNGDLESHQEVGDVDVS